MGFKEWCTSSLTSKREFNAVVWFSFLGQNESYQISGVLIMCACIYELGASGQLLCYRLADGGDGGDHKPLSETGTRSTPRR